MVISYATGFAQDFTFDGHNCKPGADSEWGIPDHADNDTDGDGYGERDTPTGTADVLNLWFRQSPQYLYLAFERRKSGNSFFSFYLNTDCDPNTGDPSQNGADIALAFDIRPGSNPQITNNLIYEWDGNDFKSTGKRFEAKVGKESCDGDLGKFFEFRIAISEIFDTCGGSNNCHTIGLNLASANAGGSPNSAHKDDFDFPVSFGINSEPTAAITAPDEVCAHSEITLSGESSVHYDAALYNAQNAPDFMDGITAYEWDLDYDGNKFKTGATTASVNVTFNKKENRVIALRVTDSYGCTNTITHSIKVEEAPEAVFEAIADGDCGMQYHFDASKSKGSSKQNCIIKYEWDFNYDGTFETMTTGEKVNRDFPNCGTYTVALRITDDSDQCNSTISVQTIEVTDTEAPQFTVPADLEISSADLAEDLDLTGNVTDATDNCQVGEIRHSDVMELNSCGGGTLTRTWTVTDNCGNETVKTQKITISEEEVAYEITAPDDIQMECGINYIPCIDFEGINDVSVFTHAGRTITVSAGSSRGSRTPNLFDSSNPTSSDKDLGTPNEDFGGPGIGAEGRDGSLYPNYIPEKNILIIQNPSYNVPNDLNEKGAYLDFDLSAFNGVALKGITIMDVEDNQSRRRIELYGATGNLIGTANIPAMGDNGATTIDLSGFTDVFRMKVILDGSGAVTSVCFANEGFDPGIATVNTECTPPPGIWYEDQVTATECGVEEIIRTWMTTDRAGNIYSDQQLLTFYDNEAPVFNEVLPENLEVSCDLVPEPVELTATDNCDPDIRVEFMEVISGMDDECASSYTITRTWTATDCSGNSTAHTQTITVTDNKAPVFNETLPADVAVSCGEIPEAETLSATDNCDSMVEVTMEESVVNNACGSPSSVIRTWTVTDCSGNSNEHTQTITITDDVAPIFNEELPSKNLKVSCSEIPDPAILTATDACSGEIDVIFEEEISQTNNCGTASEIRRTWTAADCSGNSVSYVQTITVTDDEAPEFTSELPGDITVNCSAIPEVPVLTALDNCDVAVAVEMSEDQAPGKCPGSQVITRTWTAQDCAGNTSTHTQVITVEDNEGPVLDGNLDTDITVSCGTIPDVPELVFSDGCSGNVEVSFTSDSDFESFEEDYQIVRTWTARDACGNTTTLTQTIFVMNDHEEVEIETRRLCLDDSPVNLNSFLPQEVVNTGKWRVINRNFNLRNDIFDPEEADLGTYTLRYEGDNGQCGVRYTLQLDVHDECVVLPCTSVSDVVISKTITPNGDAYNEYFTVKGVNEDCGFRITVKIFNRWGLMVYSSNDYKNNWNGFTNNNAIGSSGQVPSGTYYYVVELIDSGLDPFTGYIYVGTGSN